MSILEQFISNLQGYLSNSKRLDHNILRKHTQKLTQQGDVSFPLDIKNWYNLLDKTRVRDEAKTIFDYNDPGADLESQIERLRLASKTWFVSIEKSKVNDANLFIFLEKSSEVLRMGLREVIDQGIKYGSTEIINRKVHIEVIPSLDNKKIMELDLTALRMKILQDVSLAVVNFVSNRSLSDEITVYISKSLNEGSTNILCGPVLNENGVKSTTPANDLYCKRTSDMRMMAQHKYGIQVEQNPKWFNYFQTLSAAAIIIEMLTNKPQKPVKITLNELQTTHKGASFIFYNCARLAALFRELDKRVSTNIYPGLPDIGSVDFSLLSQPEEWELFYVYIMQFPGIVRNSIKDIERGIFNPQYLIAFLSNLSSLFSVYYRRVRILTDPREHLFSILHARIYLLKGLQCVFQNCLKLINIEPIKEM